MFKKNTLHLNAIRINSSESISFECEDCLVLVRAPPSSTDEIVHRDDIRDMPSD